MKTKIINILSALIPFAYLKRKFPNKFIIYGHLVSDKLHTVSSYYNYPSLKEFDRFVITFKKLGYTFVSLSEYLIENDEKKILLTFDDGYKSIYDELNPYLLRQEIPYAIFILTNSLSDPAFYIKSVKPNSYNTERLFLSKQEILNLKNQGVHIGFHTRGHIKIEDGFDIQDDKFIEQLTIPIEYEDLFSQPLCFSYPYLAPQDYERFNRLMADKLYFKYFFDTKGFHENIYNHFFRVGIDVKNGLVSKNKIQLILKRQLISSILHKLKRIL